MSGRAGGLYVTSVPRMLQKSGSNAAVSAARVRRVPVVQGLRVGDGRTPVSRLSVRTGVPTRAALCAEKLPPPPVIVVTGNGTAVW